MVLPSKFSNTKELIIYANGKKVASLNTQLRGRINLAKVKDNRLKQLIIEFANTSISER